MKKRLLLLPLTLFVMWAVFAFSPIQAISTTAMEQNTNKQDNKKKKKQKKQEVELKSSKGTMTGKGSSDPNIKEDEMANNPNSPLNAEARLRVGELTAAPAATAAK